MYLPDIYARPPEIFRNSGREPALQEVRVRLTGQVTDPSGKPLPFASLQLTPGLLGTMSNEQGRFDIELDTGSYLMQIHFLGYEPKVVSLKIGVGGLQTRVVLAPQVFHLQEVKVKAGAEDPAYALMRRAIKNAPLHIQALQSYSAQSYVKGTFRIQSAPYLLRKAIERENFTVGTTYVLESVSDLNYRAPSTFTERVRSLRSSLPPGTENQIRYTQLNLYRPRNGELISPLAPNSFTHYRFRYRGESRQGGQILHRIEIEPRTRSPYLFKGEIYLREPQMGLYATNLMFRDDNGIGYTVSQQYQPVQGWWMPATQEIKLKATYLGVSGDMRYVTSLRQYRLQVDTLIFSRVRPKEKPDGQQIKTQNQSGALSKGKSSSGPITKNGKTTNTVKKKALAVSDVNRGEVTVVGQADGSQDGGGDREVTEAVGTRANRQTRQEVRAILRQIGDTTTGGSTAGRDYTYRIDSTALMSHDTLWEQMRMLPLEPEETEAYQEADSLYQIRYAKWKRDSLNNLPRLRWHHILTGHTYQIGRRTEDGRYPQEWEWKGAFAGLRKGDVFNTVEGWVLRPSLTYLSNQVSDHEHSTKLDARYAFGRERLLLNLQHNRNIGRHQLKLTAGKRVTQYNSREPVSPSTNLIRTLLEGQNLLNLYDLTALEAQLSLRFSATLKWNGTLAWHKREPLENLNGLPGFFTRGGVSPNHPYNEERYYERQFYAHNALLFNVGVEWLPGTRLSRYNGRIRWEPSGLPQISCGIRAGGTSLPQANPKPIGSNYGYPFAEGYAGIKWSPNLTAGKTLQIQIDGGAFLLQPTQFIDFRHFNGLLSRIQSRGDNRFRDLDIYAHSTSGPWSTLFMRIGSGRMLLNRVEAFKQVGLGEGVFVSGLITQNIRHLELGYSLFTPFEALGIDGFVSFDSRRRSNTGFRIVLGL